MKHRWIWAVVVAIGTCVVGVLSVPSAGAEPLATVDGEPVQVRAERLEIDLKSGVAVLSGDVRLQRGALEVTCGRLEARYDKAPAVRWAKATGGVRATMRELSARASEAELALDRKELTLRGNVRVSRGGAWMRAAEAVVDLKTNRVTLQHVRGAIPVPSALPRPSSSR